MYGVKLNTVINIWLNAYTICLPRTQNKNFHKFSWKSKKKINCQKFMPLHKLIFMNPPCWFDKKIRWYKNNQFGTFPSMKHFLIPRLGVVSLRTSFFTFTVYGVINDGPVISNISFFSKPCSHHLSRRAIKASAMATCLLLSAARCIPPSSMSKTPAEGHLFL